MATHSYAYIPTGRKPFEYMLSEGWSDGYLSGVGMLWFQSTPHLDQAIEATRILGGSPCFVMPDGVFVVKEEGFYEDGVTDSLDPDDFDIAMIEQEVNATVESIMVGDLTTAKTTWLGQLSLEQQLELDIALNLEVIDHLDAKENLLMFRDRITDTMDLQVAAEAAKSGTLDCSVTYYFDVTTLVWWTTACIDDRAIMQWLPVSVALYLDKDTQSEFEAYFETYKSFHPNDIEWIESLKQP